MKKTEKLNIGGFAFSVEEDAAAALRAYLDSVRREYSNDSSADEICSDIEERIGELLVEKSGSIRIVTLDMVAYAKSVMGEFESEGSEESGSAEPVVETPRKRRLFRDVENKFLAGVFSGLAAFTDIDVVFYRVAYAVLCLAGLFLDRDWSQTFSGILLLAYVVMWICVPAARTVEQKCQLSGKPITVTDFSRTTEAPARSKRQPSELRGTPALHVVGRAFLIFFGIQMVLIGAAAIIGCSVIDMIPKIVNNFVDDADVMNVMGTLFTTKVSISFIILALLFAAWNIYAGVLLIFNLNAPKWRPGLILFVAFFVVAIAFTFFVVRAALNIPMLF